MEDTPEKEVDVVMEGATFLLIYSSVQSHLLCVCVCVCVCAGEGGGSMVSLYYFLDF